MRPTYRTFAILLPVCLLLASTCKEEDSIGLINVQLNTPFEVGIHEKAVIQGSNLAMEITEIADNRCPPDVQCFSAGDAKVRLNISGLKSADTVLIFCIGQCEGRYRESDTVTIQHQQEEYSLVLSEVNPYPGKGSQEKTAIFTLKKD